MRAKRPCAGEGDHDLHLSLLPRSDNESFVRRLCNRLTQSGFRVWFDRVSMPSRQLTFHQEIREENNARFQTIHPHWTARWFHSLTQSGSWHDPGPAPDVMTATQKQELGPPLADKLFDITSE
jgi:hypothetical protein